MESRFLTGDKSPAFIGDKEISTNGKLLPITAGLGGLDLSVKEQQHRLMPEIIY